MIPAVAHLALILAACADDPSTFRVVSETPTAPQDRARLVVEVQDGRAGPDGPMPLPVRVVVTASDGSHPDGSGRGAYSDGRFFADGSFTVDLPPGRTRVVLRSG